MPTRLQAAGDSIRTADPVFLLPPSSIPGKYHTWRPGTNRWEHCRVSDGGATGHSRPDVAGLDTAFFSL